MPDYRVADPDEFPHPKCRPALAPHSPGPHGPSDRGWHTADHFSEEAGESEAMDRAAGTEIQPETSVADRMAPLHEGPADAAYGRRVIREHGRHAEVFHLTDDPE